MNANKTEDFASIGVHSWLVFRHFCSSLVVSKLTTKETKWTKGLQGNSTQTRKTIRQIRAIRWPLPFHCEESEVLSNSRPLASIRGSIT